MSKNEKEKCFVIMPISNQGDYPEGHFQKVYEQIFIPAIEDAGYQAYRVDEDNMSTPIIEKIFRAIQECPMAICDLSNRNPNVLYELGIRQAYDKPVVLIQDDKTERIFDVSGINTVPYKSTRLYEDVLEARRKITESIVATKDGKHNTIVKVVKAQSAVVSSGDMSKEDKIEVLLSGLIKDVNDIKRENRLIGDVKINGIRAVSSSNWKRSIDAIDECDKDHAAYAILDLKQGVTDRELHKIMTQLISQNSSKIEYQKNGDMLSLTIYSKDRVKVEQILNWLQEKLGK